MGKKIDLVGKNFNYLTVIQETNQRKQNGSILWLCQCKCGNTTLATSTELKSGHKKSCGCFHREQIKSIGQQNVTDLTGQIFGELTVINKGKTKISTNGSRKLYWICKCSCGNVCEIAGQSLKDGNTRSCGCIKSLGEQKIIKLLQQANIPFQKEKRFEDLKQYSFDFYVNNEYIIEYDGKQHFQPNSWSSHPEELKKIQQRDKNKNEYCFKNKIPIIRIPYTQYDKLSLKDLLLENNPFLIN